MNAFLPVLVPAVIGLIVVSAAAALALAWTKDAAVQQLVRRAWVGIAVLIAVGVVVFWVASAMAPGAKSGSVDRNLQQEQQSELHQRLQQNGH